MLQQAEHTHWVTLKEATGVPAMYKRGKDGIEITVVPAHGNIDALSFDGQPLHERSKVFIVSVVELKTFYPPKKGDTIELRLAGRERKHCVLPLNDGGSCYHDSGNYGVMCRIHTEKREK
jgi:hypothetical protein